MRQSGFRPIPLSVRPSEEAQARREAALKFGGRGAMRFRDPTHWVGDLGEIKAAQWAGRVTVVERWSAEPDDPDLIVAGVVVDVKALHRGRERSVPPLEDYWGYVPLDQLEKEGPATEMLFCSYDAWRRILWLCGGLPKEDFVDRAALFRKGQVIPPALVARVDTKAMAYGEMEPPPAWLDRVIREGVPAMYAGR